MHLVYTSPAAGKYETDRAYSLDELKEELSIELIKEWFIPVNGQSWEDLEAEPVAKKSKPKEIPVEEE
jgi:hypothetical protein